MSKLTGLQVILLVLLVGAIIMIGGAFGYNVADEIGRSIVSTHYSSIDDMPIALLVILSTICLGPILGGCGAGLVALVALIVVYLGWRLPRRN